MKKIILILFILTILIIIGCNNNLTNTEIIQINEIINKENKEYADMGEKFSGIPKMSGDELSSQYLESQRMAPGIDLFKMNMANKTPTDDIDNQIQQLETKKGQLYATAIKDARARGFDIDPTKLSTYLDKETKAIDDEISYRQEERKRRLSDSEQEAEYQYHDLSNQLFLLRSKQLKTQKEIYQKYNKRFKNNKKIKALLNDLDGTNKKYEILKKQLIGYGIKDINIILRNKYDNDLNYNNI